MDFSKYCSEDSSPSILTPRSVFDSKVYFPTIDKSKSIKKLSRECTQKSLTNRNTTKTKPILIKQELIEILHKIKTNTLTGMKTRILYQGLELIARENEIYSSELRLIIDGLYQVMFCDKSILDQTVKNWIYEQYDDFAADIEKTIPLFHVNEALSYLLHSEKQRRRDQEEQNKEQQIRIGLLEKEIIDLKSFINKNNKNTELEEKLLLIEKEKGKLLSINASLEKKLKDISKYIEELDDELKRKENLIQRKNIELQRKGEDVLNLTNDKTKLMENIKSLNSENKQLIEYTQILIKKCKDIKQECEEFESKLRAAENKNHTLSIRAAEGFENLTPRPSMTIVEPILQNIPNNTREKVSLLIDLYSKLSTQNKKRTFKLKPRKKNMQSARLVHSDSKLESIDKILDFNDKITLKSKRQH